MAPASIIPTWLIPSEDLVLGMLFKSLEDPLEGTYPDKPAPFPNTEISGVPINDLVSTLAKFRDTKAKLDFTKFLTARLSKKSQHGTTVKASAKTYTLKNAEAKFEALIAAPSSGEISQARTWVESRNPVYLLVGKSTLSKSVFSEDGGSASELEGQGALPAGQLAAAAISMPFDPLGGAADIVAQVNHQVGNHYRQGYSVDSEVVWELKYQRIKKRWWDWDKQGELKLEKSKAWVVNGTARGEDIESKKILEVSLEDEETVLLEEQEEDDDE